MNILNNLRFLMLFVALSPLPSVVSSAEVLPKIVYENNIKKVVFPDDFIQHLSTNKVGLRIPGPADVKGPWKAEIDSMVGLPFVCWGDFDGNGMTDIGIVLLGPSSWEFTVFLKTDSGYKQSLRLGRARNYPANWIIVESVEKGRNLTTEGVDQNTGELITYSHSFVQDAVVYRTHESPVEVFYWVEGKLKHRLFGGE